MALGERLKRLREKLSGEVSRELHEIVDVDPDSSSAPIVRQPPTVSASEVDAIAAGFPPELR